MKIIGETMHNLEKCLKGNGDTFKKVNTKSSHGFIYTVTSGDLSYTVNLKLDEKLGFMVFEAYPGVSCKHPVLVPMLIKYCQNATLEVGSLRVGAMFKDVYFRTEVYFADGKVSKNTLKLFENYATAAFEAHLPVIECIANGRLEEDAHPIECAGAHRLPDNTENYNKSVEAIKEYLLFRGDFNTIAENMSPDSPVMYIAEAIDEDNGRIKLEFITNPEHTVIRVKATPGLEGERVSNEYSYMTSRFCNDKSDEKKLGSFFVDARGGACCFVDLAIIDTPLSIDALNRASTIILGMIDEHLGDFKLVSIGIIPERPRLPGLFTPGLRNFGALHPRRMMDDIDKKIEDLDFKIANFCDGDKTDNDTDDEDSEEIEDFPDFDSFFGEDDTDGDD